MDIVIHCPNELHQKPIFKMVDGQPVERTPSPKILFVASDESEGSFKVQCSDRECRKSSKGKGWFEVSLNGLGGYAVKELPPQWFKLQPVPYVVEEE